MAVKKKPVSSPRKKTLNEWDWIKKRHAEIRESERIGNYGGGKYHNCIHYVGSGKCVHPTIGDRKKGGSGICRYTAETEQKCPGYFGYDKYYSHSKGGRK